MRLFASTQYPGWHRLGARNTARGRCISPSLSIPADRSQETLLSLMCSPPFLTAWRPRSTRFPLGESNIDGTSRSRLLPACRRSFELQPPTLTITQSLSDPSKGSGTDRETEGIGMKATCPPRSCLSLVMSPCGRFGPWF